MTSGSIEKFRLENQVRLIYFKHRGDLEKILEELQSVYPESNITFDFVKKAIDKFKKQVKRDNNLYVAQNLMEYVFMGSRQREVECSRDLEQLEDHKFLFLSACCNRVTRVHIDSSDSSPQFTCLKCGNRCNAYRVPNMEVFGMQERIRKQKKEDEEHLVKAAADLGFTGGVSPSEIHHHKSSILVLGGGAKKLPAAERKVLEGVVELDPRSREHLRKDLEKRMTENGSDQQQKEDPNIS